MSLRHARKTIEDDDKEIPNPTSLGMGNESWGGNQAAIEDRVSHAPMTYVFLKFASVASTVNPMWDTGTNAFLASMGENVRLDARRNVNTHPCHKQPRQARGYIKSSTRPPNANHGHI
jgi:hypothetical protein